MSDLSSQAIAPGLLSEWPETDIPLVIGVAGGSGSGKTTIARAIVEGIGEDLVTLVEHDSYYRDQSHLSPDRRAAINYDHPDSLETELLVEHLVMLLSGTAVDVPVYDFTVHSRQATTNRIESRPVILVEGILVLAEVELRRLFDLKVFVDTDPDIRLMRRLRRDIEERGRSLDSVLGQYTATVRPMHLQFVEGSKRHADIIIPEGYNAGAVGTVVSMVRQVIADHL